MRSSFGRTKPPGSASAPSNGGTPRLTSSAERAPARTVRITRSTATANRLPRIFVILTRSGVIVVVTIDHGGAMADITHLFLRRHLRSAPTAWTRHSVGGRTRREGV